MALARIVDTSNTRPICGMTGRFRVMDVTVGGKNDQADALYSGSGGL